MKTENEKTVRVRVAVVVDENGRWAACGWSGGLARDSALIARRSVGGREMAEHFFDLDVSLPLPLASTVEADVVGEVER